MAETNLNKYLRPLLLKVAERYVRNLRASLYRREINDLEKLSKSITADVVIKSSADFEIRISWLEYGDSLNFGADVGFLDEAGKRRLEAWVVRKLGEDKYIRGRNGKRVNNARRIAYAIQKNWVRTGKFPSNKSKGRGWASTALRSREIADTKKALQENLTTAYNQFVQDKIKALNKKNAARRR